MRGFTKRARPRLGWSPRQHVLWGQDAARGDACSPHPPGNASSTSSLLPSVHGPLAASAAVSDRARSPAGRPTSALPSAASRCSGHVGWPRPRGGCSAGDGRGLSPWEPPASWRPRPPVTAEQPGYVPLCCGLNVPCSRWKAQPHCRSARRRPWRAEHTLRGDSAGVGSLPLCDGVRGAAPQRRVRTRGGAGVSDTNPPVPGPWTPGLQPEEHLQLPPVS